MQPSPSLHLQASFNRAMTWAAAFAGATGDAVPYNIAHGPVMEMEGPLAGLQRVMAWLEVTGIGGMVTCLQLHPRKLQMPRRLFYEQAHVTRGLVYWYSLERALQLAKEKKSTGPWHERLIEIQNSAQYRLIERQGRHDV